MSETTTEDRERDTEREALIKKAIRWAEGLRDAGEGWAPLSDVADLIDDLWTALDVEVRLRQSDPGGHREPRDGPYCRGCGGPSVLAYCDDCAAPTDEAPEGRDLREMIEDALFSYRTQHLRYDEGPDVEGDGMQLADVFTPESRNSIAPGVREIELLADELAASLVAAGLRTAPPEEEPHPCPVCGEKEAKRLTTVTLRPCPECADEVDEPAPPVEEGERGAVLEKIRRGHIGTGRKDGPLSQWTAEHEGYDFPSFEAGVQAACERIADLLPASPSVEQGERGAREKLAVILDKIGLDPTIDTLEDLPMEVAEGDVPTELASDLLDLWATLRAPDARQGEGDERGAPERAHWCDGHLRPGVSSLCSLHDGTRTRSENYVRLDVVDDAVAGLRAPQGEDGDGAG